MSGLMPGTSSSSSSSRVTLTSDEVNVLVYRYLLDSGFRHAAYVFQTESQLHRSPMVSVEIAPGALVTYLQKGLLYLFLETHITEDGQPINCSDHFSLLRPHEHLLPSPPSSAPPGSTASAAASKPLPDYERILHRTGHAKIHPQQSQPTSSMEIDSTPQPPQPPPPSLPQQQQQQPVIAAVAVGRMPVRATGMIGNFVAALTLDGRVTACDLSTGAVQFLQPVMPEVPVSDQTLETEIISVSLAPEGYVLAMHARRGVAVWEIGNPRSMEISGGNISGGIIPRWAPGARRFSVLTQSRNLLVFSRREKIFEKFPITLPERGNPLDVIWVSGKFFLVGLDTGKFLVFKFSDHQNEEISVLTEIPTQHQIAFRFAFSGSSHLAVAGNCGVDLFHLEISDEEISVRHLRSLVGGHKDLVSELAWSENSPGIGNLLATACDGGVVNVWNSGGDRIAGWSEIPAISALVWTNPGSSPGDFRSPFLVVGLERGKVRVYEGMSGNFCEEIGNEDIQVEDVGAVVDEISGTAFLAVLGMNSRSLRVASRKLDVWKAKNLQTAASGAEIKSQD